MMNCKEATKVGEQKLEGKISLSKRIDLFFHLLMCKYCRAFIEQSKIIGEKLRLTKSDYKLTEEEKASIAEHIDAHSN